MLLITDGRRAQEQTSDLCSQRFSDQVGDAKPLALMKRKARRKWHLIVLGTSRNHAAQETPTGLAITPESQP